MSRSSFSTALAPLMAALLLAWTGRGWCGRPVVPVVTTSLRPAYGEAVEGIRRWLRGHGYRMELVDLAGRGDPGVVRRRLSPATAVPIITVGTPATDAVRRALPEARLVFTMVLRPKPYYFTGGGATGVAVEIPVGERLAWFKRLVPSIRRVAILYTPHSRGAVAAAREAAPALGVEVVPIPLKGPWELPRAEEALASRADSLLAVADGAIYNEVLIPHIILFTIRNHIPFMGLSRSFTRSGALLSLDFDYRDAGAQAAEMALEVLEGRPISSIPVATPRRLFPVVNGRIAGMIHVRVAHGALARGE